MRVAVFSTVPRIRRMIGGALTGLGLAACATQPQPGASVGPFDGAAASDEPAGPIAAALLLPQSGRQSEMQAVSRDIEAAARLAAEEFGSEVTLSVYDTGADPQRAASAAARALAEGADVLLGPVFAQTTDAVAPVAAERGAPVMSFTSYTGSARPGVYILGETPENQVDRIVSYAASQGLGSFALVYPQGLLGDVVAPEAREAARSYNIGLVSTLSYPRSEQGVSTAVGAGAGEVAAARPDAVLVPDGGRALPFVVSFLAPAGLRQGQVQMLGLKDWETPAALNPSNALIGGWFPALDPAARERFAQRFAARAGRQPTPLAYLGYDGVVAIGTLARSGGLDAGAITRPTGFPGAYGPFRFTADGANERALAVMEPNEDGFVVRDPAPSSFVGGS